MHTTLDQLRAQAEAALNAYRRSSDDPVVLTLDDQHHIEISPPTECHVTVYLGRAGAGNVRARYTDCQAQADIYDECEENLQPCHSIIALTKDLRAVS
jgi:hypothetical protein